MGIEIERKYLVDDEKFLESLESLTHGNDQALDLEQFYLSFRPEVRVRISGYWIRRAEFVGKAALTIKGSGEGSGEALVRREYEYSIPLREAIGMRDLRVGHIIKKRRRIVYFGGKKWEADEFFEPARFWMAEVELGSEGEALELPSWILEEITGGERAGNAYLAEHGRCKLV